MTKLTRRDALKNLAMGTIAGMGVLMLPAGLLAGNEHRIFPLIRQCVRAGLTDEQIVERFEEEIGTRVTVNDIKTLIRILGGRTKIILESMNDNGAYTSTAFRSYGSGNRIVPIYQSSARYLSITLPYSSVQRISPYSSGIKIAPYSSAVLVAPYFSAYNSYSSIYYRSYSSVYRSYVSYSSYNSYSSYRYSSYWSYSSYQSYCSYYYSIARYNSTFYVSNYFSSYNSYSGGYWFYGSLGARKV